MWIRSQDNVMLNAEKVIYIKYSDKPYHDVVDFRDPGTWAHVPQGYIFLSSTDTTGAIYSALKDGATIIDLKEIIQK